MKVFFMEQGSDEWFEKRRGIPTASRFDMILTGKTMKPSAQQETLIEELIGERIALIGPENVEHFTNRAIRHGINCEDEARRYYALQTGMAVQRVGFCLTDDLRFGASPDGLVGLKLDEGGNYLSADGALELKCPQPTTQIRYVRKGELPPAYKAQCHGHLIVTGLPWVDFLSYCAGCPPLMIRVTPCDYTDLLRKELDAFYARFTEELFRFAPTDPSEILF